jgi:hypothetical protein
MRRGAVAEVDPWRTAAGPGAPGSTRGLVERTVLRLGFVLRVVAPALSARMALATGPAMCLLHARPAAPRTTVC